MPLIELILPGEPKTVERGDGIACSDMEAKTAMSMLCLEMLGGGLRHMKEKPQKKVDQ